MQGFFFIKLEDWNLAGGRAVSLSAAAAAAYCLVLSCVNCDDGDADLDFLGGLPNAVLWKLSFGGGVEILWSSKLNSWKEFKPYGFEGKC